MNAQDEVRVGSKVYYRGSRELPWSKGVWTVSELLPGHVMITSRAGGIVIKDQDLSKCIKLA